MAADLTALRAAHPIATVAEAAGVTLRPVGSRLTGRCPLHDDRHPSFTVYPATASYYCFGCAAGGDVFDLCGRLWGLDFAAVLARLGAPRAAANGGPARAIPPGQRPPAVAALSCQPAGAAPRAVLAAPVTNAFDPDRDRRVVSLPAEPDAATAAVIAAAASFYHARLWHVPAALTALARRGVTPATARRCRVGYAAGRGLAEYLTGAGMDLGRAEAAGLLRGSREPFAGRLIIPNLRAGQATWLTGRLLGEREGRAPRYLSLRQPAPLLGADLVPGDAAVVVEGPFDYLVLRGWGLPVVALLGAHPSRDTRAALGRFRRLYLALDADNAGRAGAATLRDEFGPRAVVVELPLGVNDPADLARTPGGRPAFLAALRSAGFRDPASPPRQAGGDQRVA